MEAFIVTYTRSVPQESYLHSSSAIFPSIDEARKHYLRMRKIAIENVREEDDDTDEETRDVDVKDFTDRVFVICKDDGEMAEVTLEKRVNNCLSW